MNTCKFCALVNCVSVYVFKDSVHRVGTTVMSPGEQPKALRRNKAWLMGGPDKGVMAEA